jgi:hypothetical protein
MTPGNGGFERHAPIEKAFPGGARQSVQRTSGPVTLGNSGSIQEEQNRRFKTQGRGTSAPRPSGIGDMPSDLWQRMKNDPGS